MQIGLDAYLKFQVFYMPPSQPAIGPSDSSELQRAMIVSNRDACLQYHRLELRLLVGIALSPFGLEYFGSFKDFLSSDLGVEFIIFQLCAGGINAPPGQYYSGKTAPVPIICVSEMDCLVEDSPPGQKAELGEICCKYI